MHSSCMAAEVWWIVSSLIGNNDGSSLNAYKYVSVCMLQDYDESTILHSAAVSHALIYRYLQILYLSLYSWLTSLNSLNWLNSSFLISDYSKHFTLSKQNYCVNSIYVHTENKVQSKKIYMHDYIYYIMQTRHKLIHYCSHIHGTSFISSPVIFTICMIVQ